MSRQFGRRTVATVALLATLASVLEPSIALARPQIRVIDRTPVLLTQPSGQLRVCNGETKSIAIKFAIQVTYTQRGSSRRQVAFQAATGGIIRATVSDPSIGSIVPPFRTATTASPTVAFRFTAGQPGRGTIRFSEAGRYNIGRDVPVIVDKCTYRISGFGEWQLPDGFKPRLYSTFDDVAVIPTGPGRVNGAGTAHNTAIAGRTIAGCVVSFSVSDSQVAISGVDDRGITTLDIAWTSVTAGTDVMCGVPGGRTNTAIIRRATVRIRTFADGRYAIVPHILDADVAVPGTTYIVVKLVRTPS